SPTRRGPLLARGYLFVEKGPSLGDLGVASAEDRFFKAHYRSLRGRFWDAPPSHYSFDGFSRGFGPGPGLGSPGRGHPGWNGAIRQYPSGLWTVDRFGPWRGAYLLVRPFG